MEEHIERNGQNAREEEDAIEYICLNIQTLAMDLLQMEDPNIFKVATVLENYTRQQIKNGEFEETQKCFKVVAELLEKEGVVKLALEGIYVYGINHLIDLKDTSAIIKEGFLTFFPKQHSKFINAYYP